MLFLSFDRQNVIPLGQNGKWSVLSLGYTWPRPEKRQVDKKRRRKNSLEKASEFPSASCKGSSSLHLDRKIHSRSALSLRVVSLPTESHFLSARPPTREREKGENSNTREALLELHQILFLIFPFSPLYTLL